MHASWLIPACNNLVAPSPPHLLTNTITTLRNQLKIDELTSFWRHNGTDKESKFSNTGSCSMKVEVLSARG